MAEGILRQGPQQHRGGEVGPAYSRPGKEGLMGS